MGLSSLCDTSKPRGIYIVGDSGPLRDAIIRALGPTSAQIECAANLVALEHAIARGGVGLVVMIDGPYGGAVSPDAVRRYRAVDPASIMILASVPGSRTFHQATAFARSGIDSMLVMDATRSPEPLIAAVRDHTGHVLPLDVARAVLSSRLPLDAATIAGLCLRLGYRRRCVHDVARRLTWDRKTIWRRLREARVRPLRDLLHVGLMVHAALRLDNSAAPAAAIADSLAIDVSSLRRLFEREIHGTLSEVRRHGAVRTVLTCLRIRAE